MSWESRHVCVAGVGVSGFAARGCVAAPRCAGHRRSTSASDGARRERAQVLEVLGADVRLGPGATPQLPDHVDLVVTSPGWRPDAPLLAAAPRPRRTGLGRGRARLAAAPGGVPGAVAGPDRDQRQDHDRRDARVDARRRRVVARSPQATSACRWWTRSCRAAVRRPRRRAVELPAALHATRCAPLPPRCSTSPTTTSTGTGRWRPTQRQGPGLRAHQVACVYNVADPVTEHSSRPTRSGGLPRHRIHSRCSRRSACSASSTACLSTGPSSRSAQTSAAELGTVADVTPGGPAQRGERARRGGACPRLRRAARRRARRAARLPPGRHRIAQVAESTASATSTTARRPTRMRRRVAAAYDSVVWVAGGLAKGASFDALVPAVRTGCAASCCSAPTVP